LRAGERHWSLFLKLCHKADCHGNMVQDAYLAALALEHGCGWITTDRDFARFPELVWRHPLNPPADNT
jgi:predicted nucleic acid-binding protein